MAVFTRQLAILLNSGVNIIQSLSLLGQQIPNKYFRSVIADIKDRIRDGQSLSASLARWPQVFSSLYIALIHSGEVSGNLDKTLSGLSDFLEKEEDTNDAITAALAYPIFVSVVGVITMVFLVSFVIPKLVVMFTNMDQALPVPTLILINISELVSAYWRLLLLCLTAAVLLSRKFYKASTARLWLDKFKLKAALLKGLVLKSETARFMRTFALFLSSGIATLSALDVSSTVVQNNVLRQEIINFKGRIIKGASFSQCLADSKMFAPFVTNIVAVGEEAGALEKVLLNVAREYERDTEQIIKVFTRLLEPLAILAMGLVVGFIVMVMLLPIFQMNLTAQ